MSFVLSPHDYAFFLRHMDLYGKARQVSVLNQMAFAFYLRKGVVPDALRILQQALAEAPEGIKFNPCHDVLGRFTSGPGGDVPKDPDAIEPVYPVESALTFLLGGQAVSVAKEALGFGEAEIIGDASLSSGESDLTAHGAKRLAERNITSDQVQTAIKTAQQTGDVTVQTGKYGTPQQVYKGSNGITVIIETMGKNAGKVITSYFH